mmetsp:Transcript_12648/g.33510  ORF Transcript_12648/g.33510 Transcript_12648/m.33510 type:complete len:83 (-) Transcript_12648:440-688(-)
MKYVAYISDLEAQGDCKHAHSCVDGSHIKLSSPDSSIRGMLCPVSCPSASYPLYQPSHKRISKAAPQLLTELLLARESCSSW